MRESARGIISRVPRRREWRECCSVCWSVCWPLRHHTLQGNINEHHLSWVGTMNENFQDFRELKALLFLNKAEGLGKHLYLTSAFTLGTPIPHWLYGPRKDPALRNKKQNVRIKPLRSHRPYGRWNRVKELWCHEWKTTNTALRKTVRPKPASHKMFAPWRNPVKTAGGNGTKRPKTRPSETAPYRDRLSTILTLRE